MRQGPDDRNVYRVVDNIERVVTHDGDDGGDDHDDDHDHDHDGRHRFSVAGARAWTTARSRREFSNAPETFQTAPACSLNPLNPLHTASKVPKHLPVALSPWTTFSWLLPGITRMVDMASLPLRGRD